MQLHVAVRRIWNKGHVGKGLRSDQGRVTHSTQMELRRCTITTSNLAGEGVLSTWLMMSEITARFLEVPSERYTEYHGRFVAKRNAVV